MERYVEQLIEDLNSARKWALVNKNRGELSDNEIMEELIEIDRIIDEEPEKPMHNIFGIDPDMFPPPEKITRKQSALIAAEILELWRYFNIDVIFPDNFPLSKLYPLLVKKFREPFLYFPMGITGVEFCDYDVSHCPFGDEYCMCKDHIHFIDQENNQTP